MKILLSLTICILFYQASHGQSECVLFPLETDVIIAEYIFVFEVDSLIFDERDKEHLDILIELQRASKLEESRIAKGNIIKTLKSPLGDPNPCGSPTIKFGIYFFEPGEKYLIFGRRKAKDLFEVIDCSYSCKVSDSKEFRKLYKKIKKYLKNHDLLHILN